MNAKKKTYRHGFLGAGKMAQAILRGMLNSGLAKPGEVLVSRTSASALQDLKQKLKVATTSSNAELATRCDWIWLGLKPFHARQVLKEISPCVSRRNTVLSMMAGISTRTMRRHLGTGPALIRLMPNTPALLGSGTTGIFFPPGTPSPIRNMVRKIMSSLGKVALVGRETSLDAVTGLSGSGPAFVYYFAQALVEGGMQSGLTAATARELAFQTLLGAARMLQETPYSPQALISQVVTPGGTTEAGLRLLEKHAVGRWLSSAVKAASRRAREIKEKNECIP